MNIFVYEHLCSGSAAGDDLSPQLTPMGGAMLSAIVNDLLAADMHVSTMLDHRLNLPLRGAHITRVHQAALARSVFEELSSEADATFVIAPESDGILENWIENLESRNCTILNSNLEATRLCADKLVLASVLADAEIPTPVTRQFRGQLPTRFPVVVKPRRGAGSEWTFVCRDEEDFQAIPPWEDWIMQPLVAGTPASCAVIVQDGVVTPLVAGAQLIEGQKRLHYRGGRLPLDSAAARNLALRAVQAIPGAKGYLGVDMILGNDPAGSEDVVIEVNPRLSMSYIGLSALCQGNIASAILGRSDPASLTWKPGLVRFNAQGQITWETTS